MARKGADDERGFILAERRAVREDRTVFADGYAGSETRRRPADDQRRHPCPEVRLPLGRRACGIGTAQDTLQSLRALGG